MVKILSIFEALLENMNFNLLTEAFLKYPIFVKL